MVTQISNQSGHCFVIFVDNNRWQRFRRATLLPAARAVCRGRLICLCRLGLLLFANSTSLRRKKCTESDPSGNKFTNFQRIIIDAVDCSRQKKVSKVCVRIVKSILGNVLKFHIMQGKYSTPNPCEVQKRGRRRQFETIMIKTNKLYKYPCQPCFVTKKPNKPEWAIYLTGTWNFNDN